MTWHIFSDADMSREKTFDYGSAVIRNSDGAMLYEYVINVEHTMVFHIQGIGFSHMLVSTQYLSVLLATAWGGPGECASSSVSALNLLRCYWCFSSPGFSFLLTVAEQATGKVWWAMASPQLCLDHTRLSLLMQVTEDCLESWFFCYLFKTILPVSFSSLGFTVVLLLTCSFWDGRLKFRCRSSSLQLSFLCCWSV